MRKLFELGLLVSSLSFGLGARAVPDDSQTGNESDLDQMNFEAWNPEAAPERREQPPGGPGHDPSPIHPPSHNLPHGPRPPRPGPGRPGFPRPAPIPRPDPRPRPVPHPAPEPEAYPVWNLSFEMGYVDSTQSIPGVLRLAQMRPYGGIFASGEPIPMYAVLCDAAGHVCRQPGYESADFGICYGPTHYE